MKKLLILMLVFGGARFTMLGPKQIEVLPMPVEGYIMVPVV